MTYEEFLKSKMDLAPESGFKIDVGLIKLKDGTKLFPHDRDVINWAIAGGKRGLFESFGMHKTIQQLIICQKIIEHEGGKALIICPLGVKQEFHNDAKKKLGIELQYVRTIQEVYDSDKSIFITNYERVRDGDIDPNYFKVTSLDEASVLRGYGTKTYQIFLTLFKEVKYKYVATATPSPNKYKELIHYAGYLGIMDTGQALTRFFKRDSTKANKLTLHPAREKEFWLWVSSWALFVTKPSDLGYDDTGYDLPELKIHYHELEVDHSTAGYDKDGQGKLIREASISLQDACKEKRDSLINRCNKAIEIVKKEPEKHFILWHHREDEKKLLKKLLPEISLVYGSLKPLEEREKRIIDFSEGKTKYFGSKPRISGSGCNFQRYCADMVFVGIDYKFNDFIQAIHRCYRFLQTRVVNVHIIYTESERLILDRLLEKWEKHKIMVEKMIKIIKKYGLSITKKEKELSRILCDYREERKSKLYTAILGDSILECKDISDNSMDLIHTSIPFGNHYEYSATYNDLGHNPGNEEFFKQMDFLSPHLLRILKPGRVFACHVKDRVLFGNATGTGMPTMDPFHVFTILHYMKHGFQYFGMITIITDVVRENNQTYRLGWTEQGKDGTKMGVGCPEYILLFRKLPTDTSKAYADVPVKKSKKKYTRGRWQIDAHAFWRSDGNRFLTYEDFKGIPVKEMQKIFTTWSRKNIYDYKKHVDLAKTLDDWGKLPATFMVVAPGSWHPDVWDDIQRMLTLNSSQKRKEQEMHICLKKGSLVLTKEMGYIKIEKIKPGYKVLTHKGRWKKVLVIRKTGNQNTVKLKAQGVPGLILTPDHKLWVRQSNKERGKDGAKKTDPKWIEVENIKKGYVNMKLPKIEDTEINDTKIWWIVGRYVADGHKDQRGSYHISCGTHKYKNLKKMLGNYAGFEHDTGTSIQILIKDKIGSLRKLLSECGTLAHNKKLPPEFSTLPSIYAKSLLDGYLAGDGYLLESRQRYMATSVSKKLLLSLSLLIQRVYNVIPTLYEGRGERISTIEGRKVNCKKEWILSFPLPNNNRRKNPFILEDGAWKKVREIKEEGTNETWNIKVEDDESYTTEGCIVKNCPLQFQIVDRIITRYTNPGEMVFDPFAGLMTVPYRAIKLDRKGYGIELNPISYNDGLWYLEQAENEKTAPTLFDLDECLQEQEVLN